uniref:Uncharacterized protein n=1 Tax=Rhizophora mucronata TaxID=61149 RepID=A0A2P2R2F7_RHIMU
MSLFLFFVFSFRFNRVSNSIFIIL